MIAADGPSSTIRRLVCPEVERRYAGYVAWRGTVPEENASESLKRTCVDKFIFFHYFEMGIQILALAHSTPNFESRLTWRQIPHSR